MDSIVSVPANSEIAAEMENMGPKYTPYVVLLSSKSNKINEPGNEHMQAMVNKFILNKNKQPTVIAESGFDFVCVASRMRASYWSDKESDTAYIGVISGGDVEKYKTFRDRSIARVQGYKYGSDHLIYIPDMNEIATIFLGNPKDRENAGQTIMKLTGEGTNNIHIYREWYNVRGVKHPRYILKAKPATDIAEGSPDPDELKNEIEKFLNPAVFDDSSSADEGDGR